jgi:hypothetical protein
MAGRSREEKGARPGDAAGTTEGRRKVGKRREKEKEEKEKEKKKKKRKIEKRK